MFENLKIRQRLKKAFAIIVVISSIAGVLGALAMIVTMNRYQHALTNYGFSQGDIGKAMTVFTDVRSATRGIIGYNDPDLVDGLTMRRSRLFLNTGKLSARLLFLQRRRNCMIR